MFHFDEIFLNQQDHNSDNWLQYKLFNETGKPYVVLPETELKSFDFLVELIKQELATQPYNYRKQIFHLFQSLLLKVERLKQGQQDSVERLDHDFMLAMDFKRLIENNINQS